jgi:hypothetical protein
MQLWTAWLKPRPFKTDLWDSFPVLSCQLRTVNWELSTGDWVLILNVTQLDTREKLAFRDERMARYRDYNERTFRIGEFYSGGRSRSARFHHSQC